MRGEQEDHVVQIFRKVGAVRTSGHFVYTSDQHGSAYIESDLVYAHPKEASYLGRLFAYQFCGHGIDIVIGPANGATIPVQWTAHHLWSFTQKDVLAFSVEKIEDSKSFRITPEYQKLIFGKRVLVVDDVLTTGRSMHEIADATRAVGGIVIAGGVLWNRGGASPNAAGVPDLYSLVSITMETYDQSVCPFCKDDVPIDPNVGHGREFLARKGVIAE